jgi:hypothetical protein
MSSASARAGRAPEAITGPTVASLLSVLLPPTGARLALEDSLESDPRMLLCETLCVIRENLDHTAVADATSSTLLKHALELSLQCLESTDPTLDTLQLCTGDRVDGLTGLLGMVGEGQELPDGPCQSKSA